MINDREEIFNEIYNKYVKDVYAYFKICFGEYTADDLTQNTFIKILNYLNKYSFFIPYNRKAWVFSIVVNIKNDYLREKQKNLATEELNENINITTEEDSLNTIIINKAIRELNDKDRDVILMTSMGLTSDEIAKHIHISASAVRSRLSVARERLKIILEKYGVDVDET